MDLSFLDAFQSDSQLDAFVQDLFRVTIVRFCNQLPDISLYEVRSLMELDEFVSTIFERPLDVIQIIVPNGHESASECPYFRIIMYNWKPSTEVNYKLDMFFKTAGIVNISPRCSDAVIVGMDPKRGDINTNVSVPSQFCMTGLENISFIGDVQMNCLPSSCSVLKQFKGTSIEERMPPEIQWKIFLYLEHPTAAIIKSYSKFHLLQFNGFTSSYWDSHFRAMVRRPGVYFNSFTHAATPVSIPESLSSLQYV